MKTLVLGLGNPVLTDDGVGVRVAEAIQELVGDDLSITVQEVSIGGLHLMETMIGYDRVIIIDAFDHPDVPLGAIHRMTLDELRCFGEHGNDMDGHVAGMPIHSGSPHDASLTVAFVLGQQMGFTLPDEVIIYAIGVENVTDFSEQLTPLVAAAVPKVTAAVLRELGIEGLVMQKKPKG